ncbi:hypothetical protein PAXRUDRAFT_12090 [Paxillus rubicundulus Ve08.2h10]|uniref:Uncharacterized protein n=1 Tax=Paxillus rubicundulus Ve08.2h10 TaxID=930991 RepID=A0A0D0DQ53_9AGAM|nr:hypothetical protein PAXRUDRAFT_12090 [Paxillus rubicundulus Ve08.2h10]
MDEFRTSHSVDILLGLVKKVRVPASLMAKLVYAVYAIAERLQAPSAPIAGIDLFDVGIRVKLKKCAQVTSAVVTNARTNALDAGSSIDAGGITVFLRELCPSNEDGEGKWEERRYRENWEHELDCRKLRDEGDYMNPPPHDGGDSGPSGFAGRQQSNWALQSNPVGTAHWKARERRPLPRGLKLPVGKLVRVCHERAQQFAILSQDSTADSKTVL